MSNRSPRSKSFRLFENIVVMNGGMALSYVFYVVLFAEGPSAFVPVWVRWALSVAPFLACGSWVGWHLRGIREWATTTCVVAVLSHAMHAGAAHLDMSGLLKSHAIDSPRTFWTEGLALWMLFVGLLLGESALAGAHFRRTSRQRSEVSTKSLRDDVRGNDGGRSKPGVVSPP